MDSTHRTGGLIILEVDASVKQTKGKNGPAKCGWALIAGENFEWYDFETDEKKQYVVGQVIAVDSKMIGMAGPNRAELEAVRIGITEALKYTRKEVHIFTDSDKSYKILTGRNCIRDSDILELVLEIERLKSLVPVEIMKVNREDVAMAHQAAAWPEFSVQTKEEVTVDDLPF